MPHNTTRLIFNAHVMKIQCIGTAHQRTTNREAKWINDPVDDGSLNEPITVETVSLALIATKKIRCVGGSDDDVMCSTVELSSLAIFSQSFQLFIGELRDDVLARYTVLFHCSIDTLCGV